MAQYVDLTVTQVLPNVTDPSRGATEWDDVIEIYTLELGEFVRPRRVMPSLEDRRQHVGAHRCSPRRGQFKRWAQSAMRSVGDTLFAAFLPVRAGD